MKYVLCSIINEYSIKASISSWCSVINIHSSHISFFHLTFSMRKIFINSSSHFNKPLNKLHWTLFWQFLFIHSHDYFSVYRDWWQHQIEIFIKTSNEIFYKDASNKFLAVFIRKKISNKQFNKQYNRTNS